MARSLVLILLACLLYSCFIGFTQASVDIDVNEAFMLVSCADADKLFTANMDTLNFTSVSFASNTRTVRVSVWDPVDEKIYFARNSGQGLNDRSDISRMDIDGSNYEVVVDNIPGPVHGMHIDTVSHNMALVLLGGTFYTMDLDNPAFPDAATGLTTLQFPYFSNEVYMDGVFDRRVYVGATKGRPHIYSLDTEGTQCENEFYSHTPFSEYGAHGINGIDVDLRAGKLYWFEYNSGPIRLLRRDLGVFGDDTGNIEDVYDQRDHQDPPYLEIPTADLEIYENYAFLTCSRSNRPGLARVNKEPWQEGNTTFEYIPIMGEANQVCYRLHIYDPSFGPPIRSGIEPVNVKVELDQTWYGGFVAHMVLPTNDTILSWTMKLAFPRQVFDVKFVGCNTEVESKETVRYGSRKGTTYHLRSSGNYEPGDEQIIFLAKTWSKLRGFKRPIEATFSAEICKGLCNDPGGNDPLLYLPDKGTCSAP